MKDTSEKPAVLSQPPLRTGWHRRIHAMLLAKFNPRYERMVADRKRSLFSDLRGDVLEIGPGTGPNLSFYSSATRWIGVEPNPYMYPYLEKAAARLGLRIEIRGGTAEQIPAEDSSADAVVGTLVLCSVDDLAAALREIFRVLKPGGRFAFIEHVAAPRGTWLRRAQRLARPVCRVLADNCHPDRETWTAIEQAGFARVSYEHFRLPLGIAGAQIAGVAIK